MSYTTGMLKHRVEILRARVQEGQFGGASGKTTLEPLGSVWAAVDFQRGLKAMREGALDGTDYVLVRMRYGDAMHLGIDRSCYLRECGVTYMITEFHASQQDNIIQIKAQEIVVAANEE